MLSENVKVGLGLTIIDVLIGAITVLILDPDRLIMEYLDRCLANHKQHNPLISHPNHNMFLFLVVLS